MTSYDDDEELTAEEIAASDEIGVNIRIQYHQPDQCFAAIFVKDGKAWYHDGLLVGMSFSAWEAVEDLYQMAAGVVLHGNVGTGEEFALDDRAWLFREVLDARWPNAEENQAMYVALREAFAAAGREWVL